MYKKLLAVLILNVLSMSAMADWIKVTEDRLVTTYADPSTILKTGNKVQMWSMADFKTVQAVAENKYLSAKSQQEFDCQNETLTMLGYSWFSGNMGTGQAAVSNSNRGEPRSIPPRSPGEILWKMACDQQ